MTTTINGKQYSDQSVECKDCGEVFTFTAGEQSFFASKQFTPPRRCKACRERNRKEKGERGAPDGPRR